MPNVSRYLDQWLDAAELSLLREVSKAAAPLGVRLFLVGGSVRDILSGTRALDLDIAAAGGGPQLPETLAARLGGEVQARSEFGTARLGVGGLKIDLVAARKESYPSPGALPVVAPGSMDDDLARRDFSVNAMAVSLAEHAWGDLLDPHGGRQDLERGLIRVLHPRSFVDDPTRIVRAVRYARRAGFILDGETERLLRRDLGHIDSVSGDRVRHELERVLREPRAGEMLVEAQRLGVLEAVHPALSIGPAALDGLAAAPAEPSASDERLLAMLAFGASPEQLRGLAVRLNLGSGWSRVVRDVGRTAEAFPRLRERGVRPSLVYRLLYKLDVSAIGGCALATDDEQVRRSLELYLGELRHVRPLLNGDDLLALGAPQGPMVGDLLDRLLDARLEGLVSTRDDETTMVVRSLGRDGR